MKRVLIVSLVVVAGLSALVGGVYAFRGVLIGPHLARALERALDRGAGLRVSVGHVGGSYLGSLEVADLQTLAPSTTGPLAALDVRRLRVTYSLPSLLQGLDAFLGSATVDLAGARVALNLDERGEPQHGAEAAGSSVALPAVLPRLEVEDVSVSVASPEFRAELRGLSARTRESGPPASVAWAVDRVELDHPRVRWDPVRVEGQLVYSAEFAELRSVTVNGAPTVREARVDLRGLPLGAVSGAAALELLGGRATLSGAWDGRTVDAQCDVVAVSLGAVAERLVLFPLPLLPMTGTLSAALQVRLEPGNLLDLTGAATVGLEGARLGDVPLDRLALEGSAGGGVLRLDRLEAVQGANRVALREVTVPAEAAFAGDLDRLARGARGAFSLELRDTPSLLRLAGLAHRIPAPVPSHEVALAGEVDGGVLTLGSGWLRTDTGSVELQGARLGLPLAGRSLDEAAVQARFSLELPDLAAPAALLGLPALGGALRGTGQVEGTLAAPRGALEVRGHGLSVRGVRLGEAEFVAEADGERIRVPSLVLRQGEDRVRGRGGISLAQRRLDGVSLEVSVGDVGPYLRALAPGAGEVRGRVRADVALDGPWQSPEGRVDLTLEAARLAGLEVHRASLAAASSGRELRVREAQAETSQGDLAFSGTAALAPEAGSYRVELDSLQAVRKGLRVALEAPTELLYETDPARVRVSSLRLRQGQDRVTAEGAFALESRRFDGVRVEASLADVGVYARALAPDGPEYRGRVWGELRAEGPAEAPDGELELHLEAARAAGVEFHRAALKLQSAGTRMRLLEASVASSQGDLAVRGEVTRDLSSHAARARVEELSVSRGGLAMHLAAPALLTWSPEAGLGVESLVLEGSAGWVSVSGTGTPMGPWDLTLEIRGLDSEGWLEELAGDRASFRGLDATVHLGGDRENPELSARSRVAEVALLGAPFPLEGVVDLAYSPGEIRVRRFLWSGQGGTRIEATGTLPLDPLAPAMLLPGALALEARVAVPSLAAFSSLAPGLLSGGSLEGELRLGGSWEAPMGSLRAEAGGLILPEDLRPQPPGPLSLTGRAELRGNRVDLDARVSSPALGLSASGSWTDAPSLASLLGGERPELSGELALRVTGSSPDVGWVADGVESVRRLAGRLEGEFELRGPVGWPVPTGTVRLSEGEVRLTGALPPIRRLSLDATVDGQSLRLDGLRGELGGAPFRLSGSVVRDGEDEGEFRADLLLQGENLLFFRDEAVKVRADAEIAVKGPLSGLEVSGRIGITEGRYVKPVDFLGFLQGSKKPAVGEGLQLFSFPDPPLRDARFDLRVSAQSPFQIRNNVAVGAVRPELRLVGTGEVPVLVGEIYLDPVRLSLPAGRLTVESGVVRFLEGDPDRPRLDLTAGTRIMGYDVTLLVNGPYDAPVVTLSSVPPLPDDELLLLVLAGKPPASQLDAAAARQGGLNVATYLGKGLLAGLFGSDSSEGGESIADRFDVQLGRGVTRTGQETMEGEFRLAEGVLLERDTLYIRAERDVYDAFNAGLRIVFRFR